MKLYLAGPITGCTYDGATNWRVVASRYLKPYGITCFSPMRGKEYLSKEQEIAISYTLPEHYMSQAKHLVNRDKNDVMTSDALLVNLHGATRVSIGTMFEIAWAHILNIPSVVVMELDNIHVHPFVSEAASFMVPSLEMGYEVIIKLLTNREVDPWVVSDPGGNPARIEQPILSKSDRQKLKPLPPGRIQEIPAWQMRSENSEKRAKPNEVTSRPKER